ncbi:hypothetical protein Tco_0464303 [Tanacetum coccineum]
MCCVCSAFVGYVAVGVLSYVSPLKCGSPIIEILTGKDAEYKSVGGEGDNAAKDEDRVCGLLPQFIGRGKGNGCTGVGRAVDEGSKLERLREMVMDVRRFVDDLNGEGNDQGLKANGGVEGVNRSVEGANGEHPTSQQSLPSNCRTLRVYFRHAS